MKFIPHILCSLGLILPASTNCFPHVIGVKLDLGYRKKCRTCAIFNPQFEERLHPMHRDTFINRELSFGELSPFVGSSFWWSSMGSQFDSFFLYLAQRKGLWFQTCIFIVWKRKDITNQSHLYWVFRKHVNLCDIGENYLYTGRSFSVLVLNSILDVKKTPWTCLNYCKYL